MLMCEEKANAVDFRKLQREMESKRKLIKKEYEEFIINSAPQSQVDGIVESIEEMQLEAAKFKGCFQKVFEEIKSIVHETIPEIHMVHKMEKYGVDADLILKKILCEGNAFERSTVARLLVMRGEVKVEDDIFFAERLKEHSSVSNELESAVPGHRERHKIFPVMLECLKSADINIVASAISYLLQSDNTPLIIEDSVKVMLDERIHIDTRTKCYRYIKTQMGDKQRFSELQLELVARGLDSKDIRKDLESIDRYTAMKSMINRLRSDETICRPFVDLLARFYFETKMLKSSVYAALYERRKHETNKEVQEAIDKAFERANYKGPLKVRIGRFFDEARNAIKALLVR